MVGSKEKLITANSLAVLAFQPFVALHDGNPVPQNANLVWLSLAVPYDKVLRPVLVLNPELRIEIASISETKRDFDLFFFRRTGKREVVSVQVAELKRSFYSQGLQNVYKYLGSPVLILRPLDDEVFQSLVLTDDAGWECFVCFALFSLPIPIS